MQRVLTSDDRVLLVDDWVERGSQAVGAASLIRKCHAVLVGLTVIVNQLGPEVGHDLRVTALVEANELGPDDIK